MEKIMEKSTQEEYSGLFAEFYDVLHKNAHDAQQYIKIWQEKKGEILELGSGTGRITIPLAKAGANIWGIELGQEMIDICRNKVQKEDEETLDRMHIIKGDMTNFKLDKKFDMIIAPCNVMNHLTHSEMVNDSLSCVREHLSEDGIFIFDNSMPDLKFMVESNGMEEVFEIDNPEKGVKYIDKFTARYDFVNNIEEDHIVLEEYKDGELLRTAEANEKLAFYLPREVRSMLRYNGFEIVEEWGCFGRRIPITQNSGEMIFVCKKANL